METMKKHPETGEVLYLRKRRDGSMAESAYIWQSLDAATTLDPTDEEDQAAVNNYNGGRSITDR